MKAGTAGGRTSAKENAKANRIMRYRKTRPYKVITGLKRGA